MSNAVDDLVRQRLRALRQHHNWSLDELAERTGVGPSTISRVETGQRSVSLDIVIPLARELGIAIDELVKTEDNDDVVIRPEESHSNGMTVWPLSRPESSVTAYKIQFHPRDEPPQQQVHPGHDWMFVLEGSVRLALGDREIIVREGESAEFSTMTPHAATAVDQPATAIMIFDAHGERAHLNSR